MTTRAPRLQLVHGPTPLVRRAALDTLLGLKLWIKRDDATGGAEAGNKVRKLEFLLADAIARGSDTVVTCGGIQSNHARATAIRGRRAILRARRSRPSSPPAGTCSSIASRGLRFTSSPPQITDSESPSSRA